MGAQARKATRGFGGATARYVRESESMAGTTTSADGSARRARAASQKVEIEVVRALGKQLSMIRSHVPEGRNR